MAAFHPFVVLRRVDVEVAIGADKALYAVLPDAFAAPGVHSVGGVSGLPAVFAEADPAVFVVVVDLRHVFPRSQAHPFVTEYGRFISYPSSIRWTVRKSAQCSTVAAGVARLLQRKLVSGGDKMGPALVEALEVNVSSGRKIEEARFFVELIEALEERGESLTHDADPASEASFLFAAALNAFYGAAVMLYETEGRSREAVRHFMGTHPDVYGHGEGTRAITVHKRHVETTTVGYIRPPANQANAFFSKRPKLAPALEPGVFVVGRGYFYIVLSPSGREVRIRDFCLEHLGAICQFRRSLGIE